MTRRTRWLLAWVALLLALLMLWFGAGRVSPASSKVVAPQPPTSSSGPQAGRPGAEELGPAWIMAAQATAQADATEAASPALQLQLLEAHWCNLAKEAFADPSRLNPHVASKVEAMDAQASMLMKQRLLEHLRTRTDARAQALADWLDESPQTKQRLRYRALRDSDPLVVVLALQRACPGDAACRRELASRWVAIEPENARAQLAAFEPNSAPVDVVLDGIARAKISQSHQLEAFQLLESAMPSVSGPALGWQRVMLAGLESAWIVPNYGAISRACSTDRTLGAQCAAAAERMWQLAAEDLIEPAIAVRMVSTQISLHAAWRSRADLVEAAMQRELNTTASWLPAYERAMRCEAISPEQTRLLTAKVGDSWPRHREVLKDSPPEIARLAAERRQRNLLDLPPSR